MDIKILSSQIRNALKETWPKLQFINITDREWIAPSLEEFVDYLNEYQIPGFINNVFECEEYSMDFVINHRKNVESVSGQMFNWAMGRVFATGFEDVKENHWRNICFTRDNGLVLGEPQNRQYKIPNKKLDNVVFVEF